jgi:hypothetical protein
MEAFLAASLYKRRDPRFVSTALGEYLRSGESLHCLNAATPRLLRKNEFVGRHANSGTRTKLSECALRFSTPIGACVNYAPCNLHYQVIFVHGFTLKDHGPRTNLSSTRNPGPSRRPIHVRRHPPSLIPQGGSASPDTEGSKEGYRTAREKSPCAPLIRTSSFG